MYKTNGLVVRKISYSTIAILSVIGLMILFLITACSQKRNENTNPLETDYAPKREKIAHSLDGPLKIGIPDSEIPPFVYKNEKGERTGFVLELLDDIFYRLDREYELVELSREDMYASLAFGEIDMMIGDIEDSTEERLYVTLTEPYLATFQVAVGRKTEVESLLSIAEMSQKKIAVRSGSAAEKLLGKKNLPFTPSAVHVSQEFSALQSLLKDNVCDFVLCDEPMAMFLIEKNPDLSIVENSVIGVTNYAIACKQKDERVFPVIQEALDAISRDGTGTALSEKWFGKDLFLKPKE